MPFVIGQSDDFGFGLRHSIENCSNTQSALYFVQNQCDNHDSQLAIWQKLTFRVSLGIIQLSFEHVGFTCRVRTQFRTKIQDVFHTFSKALFYFKVTGQITPTTTMHWERTVTTIQCGRTRDSKKGTNNKTRPSFLIFPFTLSLFFNNFSLCRFLHFFYQLQTLRTLHIAANYTRFQRKISENNLAESLNKPDVCSFHFSLGYNKFFTTSF